MKLDYVRNLVFEPIEQKYDDRDAILYALSLGMGDDPLDEDELPYVYEGGGLRAVPSLAVTLCWPPFWHRDPKTGIDWTKLLHGEQKFVLHKPLQTSGDLRAMHRNAAVLDKGEGRGALLFSTHEIADAATGEPVASLVAAEFMRAEGGCGSFGDPFVLTSPIDEEAIPSIVCDYRTSPQAALLYRQASRDYMPIHADPEVARQAGFDRPVSHGLNTFGLACRAALKHLAPRAPERVVGMSARFTAPAFPGDTIRIEFFDHVDGAAFRATALERNSRVLDRGEIILK